MPKVTVILTSYNHAKYLRESIESVLNQTFTDFELIVCDDASTDESWDIIQSYTDPRIWTYRHENTMGGGFINELVSSGKVSNLIAIQHSDDIWEPQKLEKQVALLDENPQFGAVFSNAFIIGENGEALEDTSHYYYNIFNQPNRNRHEWLNFFYYQGNALCHPSVLLRKQCYDECGLLRYGLAQIGDLDMWIRLCLKYEIFVLPEKLVRFRVRTNEANSSGNRRDARIRGQFEFLQTYETYSEIKTSEEFIKVFPTAKKYFTENGFDLGFALGMIALQPETFPSAKLFGLKLLFEAINDPERAKKITEIYGFGHSNFAALSAKYDIFSIESKNALDESESQLAILKQVVAVRDEQITILQRDLNFVSATLNEIYASRGWRLMTPLRWYGQQRQQASRLIRALPVLLSRPGGAFTLFKDFVNTWRQDGWAVVKLFMQDYLNKTTESDTSLVAESKELEIDHKPSQRPEILFVSSEASRTGAPIFLLDLLRFLSSQLDLGFVILLRTGGELEHEFRKLGATVVLSNPYKLDPLVLNALKKRNIKLVYSNTITNGTVQKQLKQLGCPILCHVHELAFSIENFYGGENLKQVLNTTTKFLAGSEIVANNLREQLHLPEERIVVAHPFISTQPHSNFQKMPLPLNLPQNVIVVGACGMIGWRKGTDLFLQVARLILAKTNQPVVFVWIGGPLSRGDHIHLRYDAKLMGIEKHVIFTGSVNSHLPYFAQFDIFVLPSREDPFPLVALDAASMGIPIVCFDQAGGTPEMVETDAGIVVPYLDIERMADAIERLIEDNILRKQFGKRAQQKVLERHDTSIGGERIVEIIKTFL